MNIKFDPNNNVVKLCLMGMSLEEGGMVVEASTMFHKAWNEAADDYEKFIAAYHLARQQKKIWIPVKKKEY